MKLSIFSSLIIESPIKMCIDSDATAILNIMPVMRMVLRVADATP